MSGGHPLRPSFGARFVSAEGRYPAFEQRTPRRNQLLAALPPRDFERLLPDLQPVDLPLGWTVHGAGDRQNYLHFLTEGVVSRMYVTRSGASAGIALTGREGVVGVASFLGGESMPSEALVLSAGYGYRLSAHVLAGEFRHDGLLPRLLLRYTQALITQTGQIAACNRFHSVDQQVYRWILSFLDRSSSAELAVTQEMLAGLLGVRRESVTEAAGKLQEAGLIHCSRGHIAVLDRPRLEARVCECYAVVKREYQRLLQPEDIVDDAGVHGACRQSLAFA